MKEQFFIDNDQGYYLFMTHIQAKSQIAIFDPKLYQYGSYEHKAYIEKLITYYKTKTQFNKENKNLQYLSTLEEILSHFK